MSHLLIYLCLHITKIGLLGVGKLVITEISTLVRFVLAKLFYKNNFYTLNVTKRKNFNCIDSWRLPW